MESPLLAQRLEGRRVCHVTPTGATPVTLIKCSGFVWRQCEVVTLSKSLRSAVLSPGESELKSFKDPAWCLHMIAQACGLSKIFQF